jgi:hypothetical protein
MNDQSVRRNGPISPHVTSGELNAFAGLLARCLFPWNLAITCLRCPAEASRMRTRESTFDPCRSKVESQFSPKPSRLSIRIRNLRGSCVRITPRLSDASPTPFAQVIRQNSQRAITQPRENRRVSRSVGPTQLIRWVANQEYPGLINAGRRQKTSACLLFPTLLPVFFEVSDSRTLHSSARLLTKFR